MHLRFPSKCVEGNLFKKYISKVSCGIDHSLFLTHAGMVFAVGSNSCGQLGQGDSFIQPESKEPLQVLGLINYKIKDIFTGSNHNVIYGYPRDLTKHQVKDGNSPSNEIFIFSWGDNKYGQLGLGSDKSSVNVPTRITLQNENNSSLLCVTGGINNTYTLFEDGKLYGFGDNTNNLITLKEEKLYKTPYLMSEDFQKDNIKIIDILSSANSVLLVTDDESIICFGKIFPNEMWTIKLVCFDDDIKFSLTDEKLCLVYWKKNGEKKIIDHNNIKIIHKEISISKNNLEINEKKPLKSISIDINQPIKKEIKPQKAYGNLTLKTDTKTIPESQKEKKPLLTEELKIQQIKKNSFLNKEPEKKPITLIDNKQIKEPERKPITLVDNKQQKEIEKKSLPIETKQMKEVIKRPSTIDSKQEIKTIIHENKQMQIKEPEKKSIQSINVQPNIDKKSNTNFTSTQQNISIERNTRKEQEKPSNAPTPNYFQKIRPPSLERKKKEIKTSNTMKESTTKSMLDLSLSLPNTSHQLTSSFSTERSTPSKGARIDTADDILNQSYQSETSRSLFEFRTLFNMIPNHFFDRKSNMQKSRKEIDLEFLINNWTRKKKDIVFYRKYFLEGLPTNLRSKIWLLCLKNTFSITKEYFEIELEKSQNLKNKQKIIFPFPHLGIFKESSPLSKDLIDIVLTFTSSRPDIGYDPNLCYLVGILLINLDKFQSYVSLMNIVINPGIIPFYFKNQQEINYRIQLFKQVFYTNLPELCDLFELNEIRPEDYFINWNMSLFSRSFSVDFVMRIWDIYLIDGLKTVYSAAISILNYFKNDFMEMDGDEILELLNNSSEKNINENAIINNISKVKYPEWIMKEIKKIENAFTISI